MNFLAKSWKYSPSRIALVILVLALASCVEHRALVVSSESDLRNGLTIEQIESVLGKPYARVGSTSDLGQIEIRKYMSLDSNKDYAISYVDGQVKEIKWKDITEDVERLRRKATTPLKHGQTKTEVREIAGSPTKIVGTEFETYWIYYISESEIYVLSFKDNFLVDSFKTTEADMKNALKNKPKLQYR
jgi:outer membrane protein assembly factor BamE (lipoprotein component of BamABCDE complex)